MLVVWENLDRQNKSYSFDAKVYKFEFEHKVLIG